MSAPKGIFLERGDPELDRAWAAIAARSPADSDFMAANAGECWQYMGTWKLKKYPGFPWSHSFRHRCHPSTQDRVYVEISAAPPWVSAQYVKEAAA